MANWRGNQMIDAQLRVMVLLQETTPEGARWVDARASDEAALARWHAPARS